MANNALVNNHEFDAFCKIYQQLFPLDFLMIGQIVFNAITLAITSCLYLIRQSSHLQIVFIMSSLLSIL